MEEGNRGVPLSFLLKLEEFRLFSLLVSLFYLDSDEEKIKVFFLFLF